MPSRVFAVHTRYLVRWVRLVSPPTGDVRVRRFSTPQDKNETEEVIERGEHRAEHLE